MILAKRPVRSPSRIEGRVHALRTLAARGRLCVRALVQGERRIAVVHDRYFIERFVEAIWLLRDQTITRHIDLNNLPASSW